MSNDGLYIYFQIRCQLSGYIDCCVLPTSFPSLEAAVERCSFLEKQNRNAKFQIFKITEEQV